MSVLLSLVSKVPCGKATPYYMVTSAEETACRYQVQVSWTLSHQDYEFAKVWQLVCPIQLPTRTNKTGFNRFSNRDHTRRKEDFEVVIEPEQYNCLLWRK